MGLSLCILAKNEAEYIERTINSVRGHCAEVLVVDDNSIDGTSDVAGAAGARIEYLPYPVEKTGFAVAANWMLECAKQEWILILDADEVMLEARSIYPLMRSESEVWALPRRKWADWGRSRREEYWAYPDWQVRLFKRGAGTFEGTMHVRFSSYKKTSYAYLGPHIEHFQTPCRDAGKLEQRRILYGELARIQGVEVEGGRVAPRPLHV